MIFYLCKIYANVIIDSATNESLYKYFSNIMKNEFEISMIGELQYFLSLKIYQFKEGAFINQTKYCKELLKMLDIEKAKPISTSMSIS